jgi:hypothetical protein
MSGQASSCAFGIAFELLTRRFLNANDSEVSPRHSKQARRCLLKNLGRDEVTTPAEFGKFIAEKTET